ncbi:hypothetical protein QFC21_001597 [Naganishia friedmannii]|uniref:Uncharacterized protein n=1 Tax=Naganishia friedmannii TaxID=89922 RepID=A0ACC2W0U8_9TREE|nr:hypothetical protein QFC21_001597 [Naganishia friedmannii]
MGKKVAVGGVEGAPDTVYQANYRPVYEMVLDKEIIMRRRNDGWINATHILKVANFDKPQRTRILEREVQVGEHEKVQGGYGKSQGTWIPVARGVELAQQYNVFGILRPLLEIVPGEGSPPPAPKHITAAPVRNKKKLQELGNGHPGKGIPALAPPASIGTGYTLPLQHLPVQGPPVAMTPTLASMMMSRDPSSGQAAPEGDAPRLPDEEDENFSPSPSEKTSSSRTPSPIAPADHMMGSLNDHMQMQGFYGASEEYALAGGNTLSTGTKRKAEDVDQGGNGMASQPLTSRQRVGGAGQNMMANPGMSQQHAPSVPPEVYGNIILDYFITEKARIPECLIDPPADFDPNIAIDDDGHTALHWACAMGRLRVVKLLLTAGANIFSVNHAEQTALMRSVMFSNNYDVRKFPELYQLLHRSTLNIDKSNRTVFHHIADVALSKGKTHAARYYMETILLHLEDFPRELEDVINFQDEDGETALTLASRARSKRLIRALLDHGADPKIKNRDGKCAEDYILEDERFRSSPTLGDRLRNGAPEVAHFAPQLYHSTAAKAAAGKYVTDVAEMLNGLAQGFDAELQGKEREVNQAEGLLAALKSDIEEAKRTLAEVAEKNATIQAEQQRVLELEAQLEGNMAQKYRHSWETWLAEQEQRQQEWEAAGRPDGAEYADLVAANTESYPEEDSMLFMEIDQGRRTRTTLFKQFVTQQAEVGTDEKMTGYRKLIAAACGGIPPNEVDGFLENMRQALESGPAAKGETDTNAQEEETV